MGIINVLDTQTANMIAAGEVVERPASAVKEMLENAIDAKASHITCEIKAGGNTYIRITDNGKGISGDDLPKAILPHATSKIKNADDLDGVLTLGFRGEALAAISSVSRLEILSKQRDSDIGHKLISDENGVEIFEEGAPDGTVITVKDLFYNVPARRKFMKKDSSEASAITTVVIKAALSHPEISFKLVSEGVVKFITPGDGDLYSAIYSTLGKEFATSMTAVAGFHNGITIGGYVSRPGESRGSRSGQYFFVNGRSVQSTQIMAALEQAFRSYIAGKRFPAAVLMIDVPPRSVDVNVHPAKTEIKFADDRKIFEAVYSSVVSALRGEEKQITFSEGKNDLSSETTFDQNKSSYVSVPSNSDDSTSVKTEDNKQNYHHSQASNNKKINNYKADNASSYSWHYSNFDHPNAQGSYIFLRDPNVPLTESFEDRISKAENEKKDSLNNINENDLKNQNHLSPPLPLSESEEINEQFATDKTSDNKSPAISQFSEKQSFETNQNSENESLPSNQITLDDTKTSDAVQMEHGIDSSLPEFKVIGEAFGGYIIAETQKSLLIIDKHAAHERILYEEFASKRSAAESQYLLSAHIIRLGIEATDTLLENKDLLLSYGFEIDAFGEDSIAVRAIPSTLSGVNGIEQLLDNFADTLFNGDRLPFEKRCDRALYTLACKAAIKLGPPSKNEELVVLVEKLLADPNLRLCPHGRPIVKEISKKEIEKFFDR